MVLCAAKTFHNLKLSRLAPCSHAQGIIPAPEGNHAIAAAIREAKRCKQIGEEKVILFGLSGHGLMDMTAYDQYLNGDLLNYSLSEESIAQSLKAVPEV